MARSTYYSLLEDLRHNDAKSFRHVLETEGLPQDDHWYDYELLLKAIRLNRKRMVNYLLDKRCRVNKPARLGLVGNTPLHMVAEKLGWCEVVEKMLRLKARVTDVNADGNTPLHLAFIKNQRSRRMVKLLLERYTKESTADIRNKDGLGFMHIACTRGDVQSVQEFFDVGMSDIFSQVSPHCDSIYAGYSPLHFAVEAGKHGIADFLCQYEADVYAQDRNGSTPLHLALLKHDVKMIDILCYYDSNNENYIDAFGVSHFMAACANYDSNIVRQFSLVATQSMSHLISARVQGRDDCPIAGYTPLHFAATFGRYDTVKYLLDRGADCCALTHCKSNAAQLAARNGHQYVADLIKVHCQGNVERKLSKISSEIAKVVLSDCTAIEVHCRADVDSQLSKIRGEVAKIVLSN